MHKKLAASLDWRRSFSTIHLDTDWFSCYMKSAVPQCQRRKEQLRASAVSVDDESNIG